MNRQSFSDKMHGFADEMQEYALSDYLPFISLNTSSALSYSS